jgi:hypothetical protein
MTISAVVVNVEASFPLPGFAPLSKYTTVDDTKAARDAREQ